MKTNTQTMFLVNCRTMSQGWNKRGLGTKNEDLTERLVGAVTWHLFAVLPDIVTHVTTSQNTNQGSQGRNLVNHHLICNNRNPSSHGKPSSEQCERTTHDREWLEKESCWSFKRWRPKQLEQKTEDNKEPRLDSLETWTIWRHPPKMH